MRIELMWFCQNHRGTHRAHQPRKLAKSTCTSSGEGRLSREAMRRLSEHVRLIRRAGCGGFTDHSRESSVAQYTLRCIICRTAMEMRVGAWRRGCRLHSPCSCAARCLSFLSVFSGAVLVATHGQAAEAWAIGWIAWQCEARESPGCASRRYLTAPRTP
jgi:hypothetical protein